MYDFLICRLLLADDLDLHSASEEEVQEEVPEWSMEDSENSEREEDEDDGDSSPRRLTKLKRNPTRASSTLSAVSKPIGKDAQDPMLDEDSVTGNLILRFIYGVNGLTDLHAEEESDLDTRTKPTSSTAASAANGMQWDTCSLTGLFS